MKKSLHYENDAPHPYLIVGIVAVSITIFHLLSSPSSVSIRNADTAYLGVSPAEDLYDAPAEVAITDIVRDKNMLEFICHNQMLERTRVASEKTGLLPSVIIAQKALESRYGRSTLTNATKNNGNIKCRCTYNRELRHKHEQAEKNGKAVCVQMYDKIERSNHRYVKVQTYWQGWNLYTNLMNQPRYAKVRRARHYTSQAAALKRCGYATAPNYADTICAIIRRNNLDRLDELFSQKNVRITTSNGNFALCEY